MQSFALSKDQGTFALPTFGTSGTNVQFQRRRGASPSQVTFPGKAENR